MHAQILLQSCNSSGCPHQFTSSPTELISLTRSGSRTIVLEPSHHPLNQALQCCYYLYWEENWSQRILILQGSLFIQRASDR